MQRIVEPELLDELPAADPSAIHSRRDLRRVNSWMRNAYYLARVLESIDPPPRTVVEIGSGDGTFMLKLARALAPRWRQPVEIQLLDMQPVIDPEVLDGFRMLGWKAEVLKANLREWINTPLRRVDLVIANLFLHHFGDEELRTFFGAFADLTDHFVSCDPRRWRPALWATKLLWLIGCNQITRHDAYVSVRAGFRESELTSLWPQGKFQLLEAPAGYASHLFFASR